MFAWTFLPEAQPNALLYTMGQTASSSDEEPPPPFSPQGSRNHHHSSSKSENIRTLIDYARTNYQESPTESLAALLQAMELNSGPDSASHAMTRLRNELGEDIADHVGSEQRRMELALAIVEELLQDESTLLYQQGRQDILRQTMEDGSSLVCTRCSAVVSSKRWQQHQQYWCQQGDEGEDDDNHIMN